MMKHLWRITPASVLVLGLAAAGCGNGGGGPAPYGIEERIELTGLGFPDMLPHPTPLQTERAFPNLAFGRPVYFAVAPDGTNRNFVVAQDGRVFVFENDDSTTTKKTFLDLSGTVSRNVAEEGLLGLAFAPDFATSGFFYVMYTTRDSGGKISSVLDRYAVSSGDPDRADPASRVEVLRLRQPFSGHNGSMITFGADDYLYVSLGDGGGPDDPLENAQNRKTLLGSILRIDVSTLPYTVPADNPFVGDGGGVREEIWAYGLRNPWRFSFDRQTGDLWCGDVGQHNREEVNRIQAGDNCGWPIFEGTLQRMSLGDASRDDFLAPTRDYPITLGTVVIGGYVYRGTRVLSLQGAYIHGDHRSGRIWALVDDGGDVTTTEIAMVPRLTSFGEGRNADLIATSFLDGGSLWRFVDKDGDEAPKFPEALSATGLFTDLESLTPTPGLIEYGVNEPLYSDGAEKRRWIGLPGQKRIGFSSADAWSFPLGTVLVKHFELPLGTGTNRRLETRVLIRSGRSWLGYAYRWNDAQTDADLMNDDATEVFQVADPDAPGGVRQQTWSYPGRTTCLSCHIEAIGFVLGVRTHQLNGDHGFEAATDNQIRAWNHIGLFTTDIGRSVDHPAFPNSEDETASLSTRARAYLAVNCANCHQPGGPGAGGFDLRFTTPREGMTIIDVPANRGDLGIPNAVRVRPGEKESSVLWERMRLTGGNRMPPIAHNVADARGIELIGAWIDAGAE